MRIIKHKKNYKRYDTRVIKRFAFFPITIKRKYDDETIKETRWLETCYIEQEYYDLYSYQVFEWHNIRFVDGGNSDE